MSNVVNLKPKEPKIWVCECGCSTFNLRDDGWAECAMCEGIADAPMGGWFEKVKDGPDWEGGEPMTDYSGNGSIDFVRRHMVQVASGKNVAMIVVAQDDGTVSAWSMIECDEQVEWAKERLDAAMNLIKKKAEQ